jgi:hypothetical protein
VQLQEALAAFGGPAEAEQAHEPESTADPDEAAVEERSWYGLPDADAA